MDINIEMKLDRTVLEYQDSNLLDVVSNIGGFLFIFISMVGILLSIWNYNNFDNYIASHLYKVRRDTATGKDTDLAKEATKTGAEGEDRKMSSEEEIKPTRLINFYEWLFDLVPSFLRCNPKCCKKTREMREMQEARE